VGEVEVGEVSVDRQESSLVTLSPGMCNHPAYLLVTVFFPAHLRARLPSGTIPCEVDTFPAYLHIT
jgi:hypothetical protein